MKDPQLYALIPHREPMLLIDQVLRVAQDSSAAQVDINRDSSFFVVNQGVPAWIGLEYMGQTAALIAGYQLQQGLTRPHLGFLLGTRQYAMHTTWFREGDRLVVECEQVAITGEQLAQFQCTIRRGDDMLATAKLSVYRKPLEQEGAIA